MSIIAMPEYPINMPTEAQKEKALRIIALRKEALIEQKKNAVLTCPHCDNKQLVKDTVHITNLWYEEPYGCTGGAEYHELDERDQFVCMSCEKYTLLPEGWNSIHGQFGSGCGGYFKEKKNNYKGELIN
jgi:hypothetical protein